ncbi:MAG TPA: sigma-70 family RNA polymerase sigma factor [Longimicrobiales bacterium]
MPLESAAEPRAGGTPPDERLDAERRRERLHAAIARLDDVDRAIVTMYLDDRSHREIAEVLGISKTNAGVKLHRIRKRLAAWMNGDEHRARERGRPVRRLHRGAALRLPGRVRTAARARSAIRILEPGRRLLGHLLARRAGVPFDTLLAERVLRPLGLEDTYVAGPHDADERMATGHAQAKPVPFWRFDALAGAGALRSTAADLLRFLRIQLDPLSAPLHEAILLSREPRAPAGPNASVALGWHISTPPRGDTLYWHNGGTGGFRSFIGFMPDRGIGVVLLMNSAVPLQALDGLALAVTTHARATGAAQ